MGRMTAGWALQARRFAACFITAGIAERKTTVSTCRRALDVCFLDDTTAMSWETHHAFSTTGLKRWF